MKFIKDFNLNATSNAEHKANFFPNFGILSGKFPPELFNKIKVEINDIQNDFTKATFFGENLAGNIKKEFKLRHNLAEVERFLIDTAIEYDKAFDIIKKIKFANADVPFQMDSLWANYQTKHEFNPLHTHSGLFSFILFVKIPYTLEELKNSPGAKSNTNCAGGLNFVYSDMLGEQRDYLYLASSQDEGFFFFFPAKLNHCVYPFYNNDEYRITISGNLILKVK